METDPWKNEDVCLCVLPLGFNLKDNLSLLEIYIYIYIYVYIYMYIYICIYIYVYMIFPCWF